MKPSSANSEVVEQKTMLVRTPELWRRDLDAAGWIAESATTFRAPDGSLWRGPAGAWQELQRRNQQSAPAEVFHVMDFIYDELDARGWNLDALALRMGGDAERNLLALEIMDTREPDVMLGDDAAEMIGKAFGTGAKLWLNLDATWRKFAALNPPVADKEK